jgi:uncharacterized protein YegL
MFRWIAIAWCLGLTASWATAADDTARPRIEVCFVLDTTGSMSGLIEGAKQKIWSITNEITKAPEGAVRPTVKIGLIGYRDRGDEYVTKRFDLTDDLDAIYGHLMAFTAGGGGDTPESVNQALHEAVELMLWSADRDVYKVIFLVGDAPPHMDYPDDVKYPVSCEAAVKKDIIINTIQCGTLAETTPVWQDIARKGEGRFVQIAQTGNMVSIESPVDAELAKLNTEMAATVVPYGDVRLQTEVSSKASLAARAAPAAAADRMMYMRVNEEGKAVSGRGDLVADVTNGTVQLAEVKPEDLPADLRDKTPAEREALIQQNAQKRDELQTQIAELLRQRQSHIDAEKARLAEQGRGDAFDDQVARIVQEQREAKQRQ